VINIRDVKDVEGKKKIYHCTANGKHIYVLHFILYSCLYIKANWPSYRFQFTKM